MKLPDQHRDGDPDGTVLLKQIRDELRNHIEGEDLMAEVVQDTLRKKKGRYMKFDPTVSTGTLLQIAVILGAATAIYTGIVKDLALQKAEIDNVKVVAAQDRASVKESLIDLKTDIKELQKSTNDIKESLAVLRGRTAEVRK